MDRVIRTREPEDFIRYVGYNTNKNSIYTVKRIIRSNILIEFKGKHVGIWDADNFELAKIKKISFSKYKEYEEYV